MRRLIIGFIVGVLLGMLVGTLTKAQSTSPLQIQVVGAHTSCSVTTGATTFCFASDGLWQSLSGATYVQLTPGTVGATGPAGPAGPVGPQGTVQGLQERVA